LNGRDNKAAVPVQSDTPAVTYTAYQKTSIDQIMASFILVRSYTKEDTFRLYDSQVSKTNATGVIVSVIDTDLRLLKDGGIPPGKYWVTVTEAGKSESERLVLTVVEYSAPEPEPEQSDVPAVNSASVQKSSADQSPVVFTLGQSYTNMDVFHLYDNAAGNTNATGVSVLVAGNTLSLNCSGGVPPGNYWVSVTEAGKTESPRLLLTVAAETPVYTDITLAIVPDTLDLQCGKSAALSAEFQGPGSEGMSGTFTWSSSNSSVVQVDNGTVTAVVQYYYTAPVTITVSGSGYTAHCAVTVIDPGVNQDVNVVSQDTYADYYANYNLNWSDEFNYEGKPNSAYWGYETGYQRNNELQYYRSDNANVSGGRLLIQGEPVSPALVSSGRNLDYASACVHTSGKVNFDYRTPGVIEVRARIPWDMGAWPAIWTLGTLGSWPNNGEIDLMELYRNQAGTVPPHVLANWCWGSNSQWTGIWDSSSINVSSLAAIHGETDAQWIAKYHVWRLVWDTAQMYIYLDNYLMNKLDSGGSGSYGAAANGIKVQNQTTTWSGSLPNNQPFLQNHYLLLNLAIGGDNGGPPDSTNKWPMNYEIDYVRYYVIK